MLNLESFDIPSFKKGSGIHIKKKNRGKFTEYCGGKVTQKCIDKAKKSGNKTLVKRATFAENARKWKHQNGGTITDVKLISKHQNGTSNGGIKRLDVESLRRDPEYRTNYNWRMHDDNLALIQDSLIARNADYAERVALLSQVIPESGGYTKPHGNGAAGYVGWRGSRAVNLPQDAPGQAHKLMVEIYDNPSGKDWTHGGKGTGVMTGKEMMQLFLNTDNVTQATKAFMKGYVRPETSEYQKRLDFAQLLKKHMK